jgi:hypothetical protein
MEKFYKYYAKSTLLEFKILNYIEKNYSRYNINSKNILNIIYNSKNPKYMINILDNNKKKILYINKSALSKIMYDTKYNNFINPNSINSLYTVL